MRYFSLSVDGSNVKLVHFSTLPCACYDYFHYDNTSFVFALCNIIEKVTVSTQMNSQKY